MLRHLCWWLPRLVSGESAECSYFDAAKHFIEDPVIGLTLWSSEGTFFVEVDVADTFEQDPPNTLMSRRWSSQLCTGESAAFFQLDASQNSIQSSLIQTPLMSPLLRCLRDAMYLGVSWKHSLGIVHFSSTFSRVASDFNKRLCFHEASL